MKNKLTYLILLISFISFGQNMGLDTTFGTNGKAIENSFIPEPIGVYFENSKYYLIGASNSITCVNYDGSRDTTFGNSGIFTYNNLPSRYFYVKGSKLLNGFIYVFGSVKEDSSSNEDIFLLKVSTAGVPDSGFGTNGMIRQEFGASEALQDFTILDNGKILAVGNRQDIATSNLSAIIFRYNPDGSIDTNFDSSGYKTLPVADAFLTSNVFSFENNFLIVGTSGNSVVLIKIDQNGNYIPSFGTGGIKKSLLADPGDTGHISVSNAQLLNDNELYFLRDYIWSQNNRNRSLKRYNLSTNSIEDLVYVPYLLPFYRIGNDQKIYYTGYNTCGSLGTFNCSRDFELKKINTNGTLDTSFNGNGSYTYNFNAGGFISDDKASVIFLHDDGKIFMAGAAWDLMNPNGVGLAMIRITQVPLDVDESQLEKPSISPNPVEDEFHIETVSQPIKEVALFDVLGKQVFVSKGDSYTINIQSLQQGIYIAKITMDDSIYSIKIIKK